MEALCIVVTTLRVIAVDAYDILVYCNEFVCVCVCACVHVYSHVSVLVKVFNKC